MASSHPDRSASLSGRERAAAAAILLLATALLSIGLREDWRLLHEDNGALFTTLALSHLKLGVMGTRAHDVFVVPATGERFPYGHHPPGVALLVAASFAVTGSDAPAVARSLAIAFHLGSAVLLLALLRRVVASREALFGLLLFAVLPMSAYFGRMVGYEPFGLFAVLLMLNGWTRHRMEGGRAGLGLLAAGIVLGGLIDWAPLFFAVALGIVEIVDLLRGTGGSRPGLATLAVASTSVLLVDLLHLAVAGHGAFQSLAAILAEGAVPGRPGLSPVEFLLGQLEGFRRYFTHAGLVSALLVGTALLRSRGRLAETFGLADPVLLRLLAVTGGASLGYVLAAPRWAEVHAYWKFYALPFTVLAMTLVAGALRRGMVPHRQLFLALAFLASAEILVTSVYMLHLRHTRIGEYAVTETAKLRRDFLCPRSVPPAP
ncbi:MAG: glycosyltransferase family 39 protein [Thermoanaerobaculia bacterium]